MAVLRGVERRARKDGGRVQSKVVRLGSVWVANAGTGTAVATTGGVRVVVDERAVDDPSTFVTTSADMMVSPLSTVYEVGSELILFRPTFG
jgi:hypothetical protein